MATIDLARRLAQLGEVKDALRAYALVMNEDAGPAEHLEAAAYTLQNGGDYKLAYTAFVSLYNEGHFREDIMPVMMQAFYEPNVKLLKNRYERNCKALSKYPYIFRKDFLPFDELPLVFVPYDDKGGYVPYSPAEDRFLGFVNVKDAVISRNFFADLEKPILADDVFSQYELEYLNDNVRASEWVGRENHVYLHYTDWTQFCAWLQVLTMKPLLEDKKLVFLIGGEIERYPIDFKAEFGIDYAKYPVKPIGIREVNKLIWHTQLSSHNGGDFFNEVFDAHPNLLTFTSVMYDETVGVVAELREARERSAGLPEFRLRLAAYRDTRLVEELYRLKNPTDKDYLIFTFLCEAAEHHMLAPAERIAPALFFQPHFSDILYNIAMDPKGNAILDSKEANVIRTAPIFMGFRYVKTFTPMRRPTTAHGGAMNFAWQHFQQSKASETELEKTIFGDALLNRVLNRSYLRDPDDRLYHDSVIVRFEDGKTNPTATFRALAAFLDVPYTESMTYGSFSGQRPDAPGYGNGFGTWAVDNPYNEYENDTERYFIEYFLRDLYEQYGYDFKWYDGAEVDEEKALLLLKGLTTMDRYIRDSWRPMMRRSVELSVPSDVGAETIDEAVEKLLDEHMAQVDERRRGAVEILLHGLRFINRRGQPLSPTPLLRLDPALMERELYH
ncbi:MAG: hypothetical protein E7422_00535 [Ruminococcaceae bacterium]|nr:hypothetical protein [Oscillospiraceae bacterium]